MSNLMGKLVDRTAIIKSVFSEMEKTVIKATKHNTKYPKEKHVRRLIVYTHEETHKIPELISLLAQRLEFPDWLVVMKTLCVFHRLLKDGNQQFLNELKYKSAIFNLKRFADMTSPEAHHQSIFVRKYSQYIEEKVLVYKIIGVEFEKDTSATKAYTIEEAFERIPRLQSQLNALLNCRASKDHLNNAIIIHGVGMMLKDSFKLYRALNDGIINILEHYFNMNRANAGKALEIYKLFTKETEGLIQFFEICRKFTKSELPTIQHAPTTLFEALESYIKDLDEGKNPNPNTDRKDFSSHFKNTNMEGFDFFDTGSENADSDSDDDDRKQKPQKSSQSQSQSQPQAQSQAQSFSPPAKQPALFDPFGDSFSSGTTSTAPSFDPFGTATQPQQQIQTRSNSNLGNTSLDPFDFGSTPSTTTASRPFDPFGATTPVATSGYNYDSKKQQIQNLLAGPSLTPTPNATAFGANNSGFGNTAFPATTQATTGFGNTNNAFANSAAFPAFGNTNTFGNTAQPQPGFGNSSFQPFPTATPQPSFQPFPQQQTSTTNPFL